MQWKHTWSRFFQSFMSHPSAEKLLLTVFWDSQGPNLEHFMETGIKCKLQQHAKKWLRSDIPTNQRGRLSQGVVVTRQCTPSYGTHHHQHHSKTKLGSYWAPSPQPRLGPFRFPFIWTPQELQEVFNFSDDDKVKEAEHEWLHDQQKAVFPMALKCLQITGQSVSKRKKDIILQSDNLLMSVIQIKTS